MTLLCTPYHSSAFFMHNLRCKEAPYLISPSLWNKPCNRAHFCGGAAKMHVQSQGRISLCAPPHVSGYLFRTVSLLRCTTWFTEGCLCSFFPVHLFSNSHVTSLMLQMNEITKKIGQHRKKLNGNEIMRRPCLCTLCFTPRVHLTQQSCKKGSAHAPRTISFTECI